MGALTLDAILALLNAHHQRATYGAVAAVLGTSPRSLMQGRPRDWRHSWVVNAETGWPSEYPAGKVHPAIEEREDVLSSGEELLEWIAVRG